jgi:hypothetical protein
MLLLVVPLGTQGLLESDRGRNSTMTFVRATQKIWRAAYLSGAFMLALFRGQARRARWR